MSRNPDILFMTEYIKNVLYFAVVRPGRSLNSTEETHFFCIDNELVYENYYSDFGPLNLGCVYKYCNSLYNKLNTYAHKQVIVHYTAQEQKKKANAAFLLGCYGVLYLNSSPRDALKPLQINQSYRPFQDATQGEPNYTITILDCLNAIKKARDLGFFNFRDFNYEEYDRLDKIEGGDLNWIVPGKFLAFIGPVDNSVSLYHPPSMYIDYFLENNVKIVIRLNKRLYDPNVFNDVGIVHYDLYFQDGTCPSRHILYKFLQISEQSDCAIAVHCKAGLGRTGTLIGCYLMKHYRMTAREAIGWMRICRPGSVIGQQQGWLEDIESWLFKQGIIHRKQMHQVPDKFPVHEYGIYSIAEKLKMQRPIVLHKTPSPPMHRSTRSDLSPNIIRPNITKVREAVCKTFEREPISWRVKTSNTTTNKKNTKGDPNETGTTVSRRSGAGDPRTPANTRSPSRASTPKAQGRKQITKTTVRENVSGVNYYQEKNSQESWRSPTRIDDNNSRHLGNFNVVPLYRSTQSPIIKNVNDAKNFLIRSSVYNSERDKMLNSLIKVIPHNPAPASHNIIDYSKNKPVNLSPASFTTASRGPTQPQHRRRLGRSPSPPQVRASFDQSRATNTSPEEFLTRDASQCALKDALSRLRLPLPRDRSSGAASLGARREAPSPPARAPSVRSDERPVATQGDLLNSIKFQRKLRKTIAMGNLNNLFYEKLSLVPQEKNSSRTIHSKPSTGSKPGHSQDTGVQKDIGSSSRSYAPRPSSPKCRRATQQFY